MTTSPQNLRLESPLETGIVTTNTTEEAYQKVLKFAGASLKRDLVDQRIIHDVTTGATTYMDGGNGSTSGFIDTQDAVGGWPELKSLPAPVDIDDDGMPDEWETTNGLDPNDPSDGNKDFNNDGYTNIEDYLNSRALQYYDTKPLVNTIKPKNMSPAPSDAANNGSRGVFPIWYAERTVKSAPVIRKKLRDTIILNDLSKYWELLTHVRESQMMECPLG